MIIIIINIRSLIKFNFTLTFAVIDSFPMLSTIGHRLLPLKLAHYTPPFLFLNEFSKSSEFKKPISISLVLSEEKKLKFLNLFKEKFPKSKSMANQCRKMNGWTLDTK